MKTVQIVDLVAPLANRTRNSATDMRITDTAGLDTQAASGAASLLSDRQGGVDSANKRSTRTIQIMPGIRTSTTVTRTTTTRALSSSCAPSADEQPSGHADFSFEELVQAYLDCRRTKRNSKSALAFEINLEYNLCQLDDELRNGTYRPGKSICFVITRPKPREVWAADFRDRQQLLRPIEAGIAQSLPTSSTFQHLALSGSHDCRKFNQDLQENKHEHRNRTRQARLRENTSQRTTEEAL